MALRGLSASRGLFLEALRGAHARCGCESSPKVTHYGFEAAFPKRVPDPGGAGADHDLAC